MPEKKIHTNGHESCLTNFPLLIDQFYSFTLKLKKNTESVVSEPDYLIFQFSFMINSKKKNNRTIMRKTKSRTRLISTIYMKVALKNLMDLSWGGSVYC